MISKDLFKSPKLQLEGREGEKPEARPPEVQCPGCKRRQRLQDLPQEYYLCPRCGHSYKMSARQRVSMVLDDGSFEELYGDLQSHDPLTFPGYQEKLAQSRAQSGESEAVITGLGRLEGQPCAFFAMEHCCMMGSMGAAVGNRLTGLFETALEKGLPVVGFTLSGGARVQEGILSLMQMAKVSGAVRRHSDAGLLYIAVLCDATTGGVPASFAMQADIIPAEPGALIGFAGPRVIEQTTRQKLPESFQRAEFQMEKGFVGKLVKRRDQKPMLSQLLKLHTGGAYGRV